MTTNESERDRLCRLYTERHKEFEAAKTKRTVITILGFAVAYFLILFNLEHPEGFAIFGTAAVALVFSGIHFWINAIVFGYLSMKGREETEILDSIRRRIKELEIQDGTYIENPFD